MSTVEPTESTQPPIEPTESTQPPKISIGKRVMQWLKRHRKKIAIAWLIVSLPLCAYLAYSLISLRSEYASTVSTLETQHAQALDSMQTTSQEQVSKVFTWAVRSELLRDNLEQTDQLVSTLVREKNISKINLTNSQVTEIVLSSDKNDQNTPIKSNDFVLTNDEPKIIADSTRRRVFTPVMGIDKKIGILEIVFRK